MAIARLIFSVLTVSWSACAIAAETARATASVDGRTYPVYELMSEVAPLERVNPVIPPTGMAQGLRGDVLVGVLVSEKGRVKTAYVAKADGDEFFKKPAVNAARQWKFPVVRDPVTNDPISYVVMVSFIFSPPDGPLPPPLGKVISDIKYLKSALGTKALVLTDDKSQPLVGAGDLGILGQEIQLIPLPAGSIRPKPIRQVAPVHPNASRLKKGPGFARFIYVIGADGSVKGLYCSASTNEAFAIAAAMAVAQWRFEPARIQGTPVPIIASSYLEFEAH